MFRLHFFCLIALLLGCKSAKVSNKSFTSETLIVKKVKDHVYQHVTYLQTQSFGKVDCNGMIVFDKNEAIIFDSPINDSTTAVLVDWLKDSLNCKVKAVIATHFHEDCVGGLNEFHKRGIPSYANKKTIESAKLSGFPVPQNGFDGLLELKVGNKDVIAEFNGEGHTKDVIIGYFPDEKAMFGGCLIKEVGASKGYLGDANEKDWSATVTKIKQKYPDMEIVIPGHGKSGNVALLDYTIKLFEQK